MCLATVGYSFLAAGHGLPKHPGQSSRSSTWEQWTVTVMKDTLRNSRNTSFSLQFGVIFVASSFSAAKISQVQNFCRKMTLERKKFLKFLLPCYVLGEMHINLLT